MAVRQAVPYALGTDFAAAAGIDFRGHLQQEEELGGGVVGLELGTRHGQSAVGVEGQHRLLIEATIVLQVLLVHRHSVS